MSRFRTTLCLLLLPLGAFAAVPDVDDAGFIVAHERRISAPAARVFDGILRVGSWWHPDHTFSGDAGNLSLQPKAQGCFCEKLPGRGQVRHLTVVFVERGVRLRLSGGLGPLQAMAVTGAMTFELAEEEGATALTLTYRVAGWDPGGLSALANPVDAVLGVQMDRLKRYIDTGSAEEGP